MEPKQPTGGADHLDVIIVGAGISGISAAYHLKTRCKDRRFVILEGRSRLGGTWDLFRYPGIRSDSDMYTLGFSFRPWKNPKAIADGPAILSYLHETVKEYGLEDTIAYDQQVVTARWSSDAARWTVETRNPKTGDTTTRTCSFLFVCAGYYEYDEGYTPDFAGMKDFGGRIVHPQHWSPDVDYEGKRVIVIGSGATAVTLVPRLAEKAAHVTMLQRSPTYVVSLPERDKIANWMKARLPAGTAHTLAKWKNVLFTMAFYNYCRRFPEQAKRLIVKGVKQAVGPEVDVKTHFTPTYNPWDQRLCLVPDGDLFEALRSGKADVVTDHIDRFTAKGIRTRSGQELEADLVVTATGFKARLLGGAKVEVDGKPVEPSKRLTYKGMMFSDVPNLAIAIGYTNASWTLKCDLTSAYVARMLNHMKKHGYATCTPRRDPAMKEQPLLDFSSGYVQRAMDKLPKQGTAAPWKLYQNYALDLAMLRYAPVKDRAMEFG